MNRERPAVFAPAPVCLRGRLWECLIRDGIAFFHLNVLPTSTVGANAVATRWASTSLLRGHTLRRRARVWRDFPLSGDQFGVAGTPPVVILVMTRFIEPIDSSPESAARIFGANTLRYFRHVLPPLLVLARTIGLFELIFFTAQPHTQTLVVTPWRAVCSTVVRAPQSIDAPAMIGTAIALAWVVRAALRFANPARLVSRMSEQR